MPSQDIYLYAYKREYNDDITYEDLQKKFIDNWDLKIKFGGKKTMILSNLEGLDIKDIIKNTKLQIKPEEVNIIVLGNIIDSTFSKNPILTKDFGENDEEKLLTYYKNIIEKKSYNISNIDFCTKDNVLFIFGNREIDKIKIKDLVELESPSEYGGIKEYAESRSDITFKNENINSFYPFWVKYYFKESYMNDKVNKEIFNKYKFLKRFKKIFKSIDAEMLLFTIYFEINGRKEKLVKELSDLAISYFYKMTDNIKQVNTTSGSVVAPVPAAAPIDMDKIYENIELVGENDEDKFMNLPYILDKLDYLAYCLFKYFSETLGSDEKKGALRKLLSKGEFIIPLKVSNNYYLMSHGGISNSMATSFSIDGLESFIKKNSRILTNYNAIKKIGGEDIVKMHNTAKQEQISYYKSSQNDEKGSCNNNVDVDLDLDLTEIESQIQTVNEYNLLLYYSVQKNEGVGKINELINPSMPGGYIRTGKSKKIFGRDISKFNDKKKKELEEYNNYLKEKVNDTLTNSIINDGQPSDNLLILLCLAHPFNSKMFNKLRNDGNQFSENIKSKDYSVLINTIYDHRFKNNVLFDNVNQIIANSNNTAQTTEAIYDSIFYGTLIDYYEIKSKTRTNITNYIISIDNSAIIKKYSYFNCVSVLIIDPDLRDILTKKNMAIKTTIETKSGSIDIFNTLENAYKVLNTKLVSDKIRENTKIISKNIGKKQITESISPFSNQVCPNMNYYGISYNNEIIFSDSKVDLVNFHGYKF